VDGDFAPVSYVALQAEKTVTLTKEELLAQMNAISAQIQELE